MLTNLSAGRFIRTPIMSAGVQDLLTTRGVSFAEKADAARAVLHFCAEKSICGRALAILPRNWGHEEGYADLCLDDYDEGNVLTDLQSGVGTIKHRIEAK